MDGSFRVAFWGLLVGFGLTVALAATDPEDIRLALDTPPPASLDSIESGTLLANAIDVESDLGPLPTPISDTAGSTRFDHEVPLEPEFVPVPDNRLALDTERPVIVPPFESISRPVPAPPVVSEHPIIDVEGSDHAGVPIEFETEGEQTRIRVVVRPPRGREFVELPAPPVMAQTESETPSIVRGPLFAPHITGTQSAPQALPLGQLVADDDRPEPPPVDSVLTPPTSASTDALDELKATFETELGLLRGQIESFATNSSLDGRLADILEAQQQLDRERVIHEIGLLRTELEQIQAAEAEAAETPAISNEPPPTVVITPSTLFPGKIDVELNSAPAAEAFAHLGRAAGQNLLTSESIQGNVTAKLQGVVAWEAILALAHSRDCQIINDAGYLVVVPKALPDDSPDAALYSQLLFPSHLAAEEAVAILSPLLTPGVGRISCTQGEHPASINRAQAVLIVDHFGVIERARSILKDVDQPPRTLQISAQIMLVRREGTFRDGVLSTIAHGGNLFAPRGAAPQMHCDEFGCCDSVTLSMPGDELCRRLRTIAEIETVSSPCLQVLDRHAAEMSILDAECRQNLLATGWRRADVSGGSSLTIRPMIAANGMIHLEVSPSGSVDVTSRRETQTTSAALSTSVLVPNGGSLVIGEVCQESTSERPAISGLLRPLGRFFPRGSAGNNSTTELVVVISACVVP